MSHILKPSEMRTENKDKTHKNRFNEDINIETTNMDLDDIPVASNYIKKESTHYGNEYQEGTIIKEEATLISSENSLEEDSSDSSTVSDQNKEMQENRWEQINHNKRTYKRKVYPIENNCGICKKKFSFQKDLVKHAEHYHPEAKAFKCKYCVTLFSKIKSITTHLKRCHPNLTKTLPCGFCNKSFFIRFQLERHRRTHIEYMQTLQSDDMNKISEKNRKGKVYPIENHCAVCAKVFSFQKDLIYHTQRAHPNAKVFKCLHCPTIFSKLRSVTTHYQRSHSEAQKTLFCDYCGMSFFTKFLLERHRRSHTECRPFSCDLCEKAYKYKRNLLVHMKTHTRDKQLDIRKSLDENLNDTNPKNDEKFNNKYDLTGIDDEYNKNDEEEMLSGDEENDDQYFLADDEYCENNEESLLTEDEYCKDDEENLSGDECYANGYQKETGVVNSNYYNTLQCPFQCNECGKNFRFKNDLMTHQKSHQENNEITEIINVSEGIPIDQDNSNIYRNTYFIIDELITDSEQNEVLENEEATEPTYSNEYNNDDFVAVNTHFSTDKQRECAVCCKMFTCQQSVAKHLQRCHPEIEFFKCPYCDDNFYSLDSLSQHIEIRQHQQKPHVCEMCLKSFDRRSDLNRHKKIHGSEWSHVCNRCHRSFKQLTQLKRHEEIVHDNNYKLQKKYNCEFCTKGFVSEDELQRHRNSHVKQYSYPCSYCDKMFRTRYDWNRHEETHSSRKNLTCEYCLRSFSNSETLNDHLKTHTGDLKFLCTICNKSYRMKSFLVNHRKSHTNC